MAGRAAAIYVAANSQRVPRGSVIGGGPACASCALAATRARATESVVKAAAASRRPPAHLNVVPNILRGPGALGVGEAVVRRGLPHRATTLAEAKGNPFFQLPARRLVGERDPAAVGIMGGALMDVTAEAACATGARFRFAEAVAEVDPDEGSVRFDAARDNPDFDVVVLATGADSHLCRQLLPDTDAPRHAGHICSRALAAGPPSLDQIEVLLVVGKDGRGAIVVAADMRLAALALLRRSLTPQIPPPDVNAALPRRPMDSGAARFGSLDGGSLARRHLSGGAVGAVEPARRTLAPRALNRGGRCGVRSEPAIRPRQRAVDRGCGRPRRPAHGWRRSRSTAWRVFAPPRRPGDPGARHLHAGHRMDERPVAGIDICALAERFSVGVAAVPAERSRMINARRR